MSEYQVLARKYRPGNFDELIGQEDLVQILKGAFATKRISHAFLFTGIRGVGKTSTARLLARALNYQKTNNNSEDDGPSLNLKEEGIFCKSISQGNNPDVIEIDAASNTGISDIREIIEAIQYRPLSCRYKIYIIDEVHMLSNAAFNALLKTLEEPPKNVIFILATTEVRKIPVTILSRCQRFDLKRIREDELYEFLVKIIIKEELNAEKNAVAEIVKSADGSVRDALSLLDQLAVYAFANEVKKDDIGKLQQLVNEENPFVIEQQIVRNILGLGDYSKRWNLLEAILIGDTEKSLHEFDDIYIKGGSPKAIINDILEALYLTILFSSSKDFEKKNLLVFSPLDKEKATSLSKDNKISNLLRLYSFFQSKLPEISLAVSQNMSMQIILIQSCHLANLPNTDEFIKFFAKRQQNDTSSGMANGVKKNSDVNFNQQNTEQNMEDNFDFNDKIFDELKEFLPGGKIRIVKTN